MLHHPVTLLHIGRLRLLITSSQKGSKRTPSFDFFYFCSPISLGSHTSASPLYSRAFSRLSFFAPAALASSCRHSETQHTSPHQGHSIGTRVLMCVSVCVCLERSLQWGHIGCERRPAPIDCSLACFPSSTKICLCKHVCHDFVG